MWARDGTYLSGLVIRRPERSPGTFGVYARRTERERVARAERASDRGGQVGGAATEHRRGRDPTRDREIREPRSLPQGHRQRVAGARERRRPTRDPIPRAERDVPTRHGDETAIVAPESEWSADDLDGRRGPVVPDERLGRRERERIRRPRRGDAVTKMTEASVVLHGGAQAHSLDADHRATNRTRSPGRMSVGGSFDGSKIRVSVRPMSRQPPGEASGYTAVWPSATATAPAGTCSRGRPSRGATIRRSRMPQYAKPGRNPRKYARYSRPVWSATSSSPETLDRDAVSSRSGPSYTVGMSIERPGVAGAVPSDDRMRSASRSARAMSAAPGVSPWTQSVSTSSLRKVPSAVPTPPFRTNKSACAAAAAGLVISAPASVRERRVPSDSYVRSTNPSRATRMPIPRASCHIADPGGAKTTSSWPPVAACM